MPIKNSQSKDRYAEIAKIGKAENIAITIVDKNGKIVYWSEGAKNITGYSEKEVLGKHISFFYSDAFDLEIIQQEINKKGYAGPRIVKIKNKNKRYVYINLFVDRFLSPGGGELGTIGISYDVTEMIRLEEERNKMERLFKTIFEKAPMGIFITDKKGEVLAANPALLKMLGSPAEEKTKGINVLKLEHLKRVNAAKKFKKVLQQGKAEYFDTEYLSLWGKKFHGAVMAVPVIEKGEITGMVGIITDITERKKMEMELKRKTKVLEKILETAKKLDIKKPLEENLNEIARGAAEACGFKLAFIRVVENGTFGLVGAYGIPKRALNKLKKRRITGDYIAKLMSPKYRHGDGYFISHKEDIAKEIGEGGYIPPIKPKEGGWHPLDMFFVPIYSPGKDLIGIIMFDMPVDGDIPSLETTSYAAMFAEKAGYWIDILKTDTLLRHELEKLNALIHTANILSRLLPVEELGEKILDTVKKLIPYDCAVLYLYDEENKKLISVSWRGISKREIKKREKTAFYQHPGWVIKNKTVLKVNNIEKDERVVYGYPVKTKSILYVPLLFEDRCLGTIGVESFKENAFSDEDKIMLQVFASQAAVAISNSKALEIEVKARRVIEEIENLKSGIIASLSHELKTPVTVIKATMELLKLYLKQEDKEIQELLNTVLQETDRLNLLISRLINLGVSLSKISTIQREKFNPDEIVKKTEITMRKKAKEKKVRVKLNLSAGIEIYATKDAFESICNNLMDNAIKYNVEGGKVEVRSYREKEYYVLEIKDTGIGIPEDKLVYIFEPFYRVDMSDARETYGAGIGLAIVKRLVEIFDGKVEVESELNKGSCFRIFLPIAEF